MWSLPESSTLVVRLGILPLIFLRFAFLPHRDLVGTQEELEETRSMRLSLEWGPLAVRPAMAIKTRRAAAGLVVIPFLFRWLVGQEGEARGILLLALSMPVAVREVGPFLSPVRL